MPNCFTLALKSAPKEPIALQQIDEVLCNYFDAPCDPVRWFNNWYNSIGFALSLGWSFDRIKQEAIKHGDWTCYGIADYLDEHYVTDAWYQVR